MLPIIQYIKISVTFCLLYRNVKYFTIRKVIFLILDEVLWFLVCKHFSKVSSFRIAKNHVSIKPRYISKQRYYRWNTFQTACNFTPNSLWENRNRYRSATIFLSVHTSIILAKIFALVFFGNFAMRRANFRFWLRTDISTTETQTSSVNFLPARWSEERGGKLRWLFTQANP